MKNIKDILDAQRVEPTPDCWNKLSSRLDMVMPQMQGGSATSSVSGTSHAFWTVGTKIVTALVGATALGAAVTFAVLKKQHEKPLESVVEQNMPDTGVAESEDFVTSESLKADPIASVTSIDDNESIHPTATSSAADFPARKIVTAAADAVGSQHNMQVDNSTFAPTVLSVAPKSSIPSVQNITIGKVALPSTFSNNLQDDPALQNLPEDAIDWNQPVKMEIPNVFTPNGDGINDFFVIRGIENCTKRQLIVRDRSGKVVFRSSYYDNSWTGENCAEGTYLYQFIFSSNNIEQTLSGFVTIIRK